ncbi:MAG: lysylphosphatidylglycerol synthase transmembrane domain-containing protein [Luteibaculum sp.]
MKSKLISAFKVAFFLSLGIGLIFLFTRQFGEEEKQEIINAITHADYSWIILSMVFGTLAHISRAMRWKQLLEPMGHNPSTRNTFFAVMVMYFANLAIPRLGEVSRCAILRRYEKVPMEKSFGTVVAERAIDLVVLGLIFLFTLAIQWDMVMDGFKAIQGLGAKNEADAEKSNWFLPTLAIVGLSVGGILFLFRKNARIQLIYSKVLSLIMGFVSGLKSAFKVKKPLTFLAHSIFIWLMYFVMVYICFFSIPQTSELPWLSGFTILIFGSLGIILVPGGIGIYPLIVAKVLFLYGVEEIYGYGFGWIVWIGQTALLLFWGILSLILLPVFNRKKPIDAEIFTPQ